jgi:glycosyltransferase involved in cell wall biosynthesis
MQNKILNLSGVIICQDEEEFIANAITNIYNIVDELVILDGKSTDKTVEVIKSFNDPGEKIRLFSSKFGGHIGDQKNLAISKVRGIWTLLLDCDETIEAEILKVIPQIIQTNKYQVFAFPRINLIDGNQTDVYPDHQLRLFRSYCRWAKAPHEELCGWHHKKIKYLTGKGSHIIHSKSCARQTIQDERYNKIAKAKPNMQPVDIELEKDFWDFEDEK